MAINPNIALGVQPVQQQPNMLAQYAQVMAIKAAQQEMEGNEGIRGALSQGIPDDPTTLLQYGKQGRATYESLLKGKKEQIDSAAKTLTMAGQIAGYVRDNPTPENFVSAVGTMVQSGVLTRAQAERVIADAGNDPTKIKSYAERTASDALTEADRLTARTRIQAANISAGPGYGQLDLARQKDARDVAQQQEISTLMRGGSTNALAPESVNALAAQTGDVYDQISGIDARIAQLMQTGNPKAIPIAQALNAQRTQLLASAKQQYGGALLPMETIDPATNRPTTIQGRIDQYGRAAPVEMVSPTLSVDAREGGATTISPSVVRPAPTTEVLKQRQIEEKLPTAIAQSKDTLKLIDRMVGASDGKSKPHEGFTGAVGAGIGLRFIPGTSASDFQAMHEQITGGAFLQAFNDLKGGGAITEKEGEKATAAITRMKLSTSEKEYIQAAREFQDVVRRGIETAEKKVRPSGATPASAGGVIDFGSLK